MASKFFNLSLLQSPSDQPQEQAMPEVAQPAPQQQSSRPPYEQETIDWAKTVWEASGRTTNVPPEEFARQLAANKAKYEKNAMDTERLNMDKQVARSTLSKTQQELNMKRMEELKTADSAVEAADYMLSTLDQLEQHPGLTKDSYTNAVGTSRALNPTNWFNIPGTNTRGFNTLLDQVKGQTFLSARQQLKGAGQITDFEGKRAEAATARLDPSLSEDEFKAAITEYKGVLQKAKENALKFKTSLSETMKGDGAPATPLKKLDRETAMKFHIQAGGDRNKARELAKQAGYQ